MRPIRGLLLPAIAVVLLAAGCGDPGDPSATDSGAASDSTEAPVNPTSEAPFPETTFEVWFARDGALHMVRQGGPSEDVLKTAMSRLMEGPGDKEAEAGVGTAIPEGTSVQDVFNTAGLTIIDLSSEFGRTGRGPHRVLAFAQIVFTATQSEGVDGVLIRVDGKPVRGLDGEGRPVDHALRREDYETVLPAILVETPGFGDSVQSPVTISGTANVFEATVSIRIVGGDGTVLAETFTTATCGSGCRGDFSEPVEFEVAEEQPGTIEVFESSGETGEPINQVDVAVTLVP